MPEGRGATVQLLSGMELALYHVGGEFYAIENFCPHKGAPLADGRLAAHTVEGGSEDLVAPDELRTMAEDAGLEVEELAGSYDLDPIRPGSERAILVARKP